MLGRSRAENETVQAPECTGRRDPDSRGKHVQRQQHPQEPGRTGRPWPDGEGAPPEMQEIEVRRTRQVVAQECRIIGDRHQHEDRYQEWHAEPPGAVAQEDRRPFRIRLSRTNQPEMKNMKAMKKLSLNSTTRSKPSQRIGSPWPKHV